MRVLHDTTTADETNNYPKIRLTKIAKTFHLLNKT